MNVLANSSPRFETPRLFEPRSGEHLRISDPRQIRSNLTFLMAAENLWHTFINQMLSWLEDSSELTDEGSDPPSESTILAALSLLVSMREGQMAPPLRITPNGEGGLVLERGDEFRFVSIEIEKEKLD